MAVTVYFRNGGHATIGHAATVEAESIPTANSESGYDGIALKDRNGDVVGRFFQGEIVGYFTHEASGSSGFR
jgi:hypothetical protein